MSGDGELGRPFLVALVAIVIGLAFRIHAIALPTDVLTARYLADDYFYYLNVAYNIAHGHGSSFDGGLTATNGYQPLFLIALVGVFLLGATKAAAIHIGLIVQATAVAAASIGTYLILARQHAAWAGALAAGVLSLNLFFIMPTLTGLEMALAWACVVWAIWCWQTKKPGAAAGLACGLAVLARVDALVLAVVFGSYLLYQKRARDLAFFTGAMLIVLAPWIVWSTLRFGSPSPDSGLIKAHYRGAHAAWLSATTAFEAMPRTIVPGRFVDVAARTARPVLWAMAVLILLIAGREARRTDNKPMTMFALGLGASYVLLIDPHEPGALIRYLFPVWAAVVCLVAQYRWIQRPWVVVLVLSFHAADLAMYTRWERSAAVPLTYVGASQTLAPAVIATRLTAEDRVAAFDSGALGYFSPAPVVNLDGLANHDIVELRRQCGGRYPDCLRDYMRTKGIRVLAGGTAFGWTRAFPDWAAWERIYESPRLADGGTLVFLRLP